MMLSIMEADYKINLLIFKQLHQQFSHIIYYDDTHTYIDINTGEVLTSVTTHISKYKQKFQRDYWINKLINNPKKEKYYGRTYMDVRNEWDILKELGTTSGNILHKFLEDRWNNKIFNLDYTLKVTVTDDQQEAFNKKCSTIIEYANKFVEDHKHIIPVKPELIVGNNKIAGQMDLLAYDTEEEEYIIVDYKSDKKIDFNNKYQTFKKPLTHLDDCEFNKYSLQLNIYRKLLQPVVDVKTMYIIWFNENNESYVKLRVKVDDKNTDLIL